MKIALVCTSLGYSRRGFERFTFELFDQLKDELPVTLFSSRLNGRSNEVSLPCLKYDRFLRAFAGKARDNYFFSQLSYAFSFIPFVVWHDYDVVHYSETAIGSFLFHARRMFGFRYKLIFTDALGLDPVLDKFLFARQDCSQAVSLPHYHKLIQAGVDPSKIAFIPYGINSKRYLLEQDKEKLRDQYRIPKGKIVILSVAALNRRHKRIDYLIREVSRLDEKYFLLVVGHPEESDLIKFGQKQLGENFKTLYVPFDQMPEIYCLADLFVVPSLVEGFCLALVEAMASGLPVIAHDSSHFKWIIGDDRSLPNLEAEGVLSAKITEIMKNYRESVVIAAQNRERAIQRFDWDHLKKDYVNLYERVLSNGA